MYCHSNIIIYWYFQFWNKLIANQYGFVQDPRQVYFKEKI